jgi:L-threonylcarbamoyladenylate synthase
MKTEILHGNSPRAMAAAVSILNSGGAIAFPTETVYGLGADARNPKAVAEIFAIKGRPANNPLIVHCLDRGMAQACVQGWNAVCDRLADQFWPGPLTLILPRSDVIPSIVAAGGRTLAVRVPSHIVARALLAHYDGPIAAPSANRSTQISPTCANHVFKSLSGKIPLILDGGPCTVGLESTVLDLSTDKPCILRRGAISQKQIEDCLGQGIDTKSFDEHAPRSPGMMRKHYAPTKPVHLFKRDEALPDAKIAVIFRGDLHDADRDLKLCRTLPDEARGYAQGLYDALHWADDQDVEAIYVQAPPYGKPWEAIFDRLSRCSVTLVE